MASVFTHAFVAAALTPLAPAPAPRWRLCVVLVVLSVLPDLDVIGFRFGIPYEHPLGHRGFSHSVFFAVLCGLIAALCCFPEISRFSRHWWIVAALCSLATASHGVLDAFTDAGLGIGFLLPFDASRYFFPWRPLPTSSISVLGFINDRGAAIVWKEMLWVWIPVAYFAAAAILIVRSTQRGRTCFNLRLLASLLAGLAVLGIGIFYLRSAS